MKKILFVVLFALSITSCKKEYDGYVNASTAIVGNWRASNDVTVYYTGGTEAYRKTAAVPTTSSYYYNFKDNAAMSLFTYSASASNYVQSANYTYAISGVNLTYTAGTTSTTNRFDFAGESSMSITEKHTGTVTYTDASNLTRTADSYNVIHSYTKF